MVTRQKNLDEIPEHEQHVIPIYGRDAMERPVPKYELPEHSLDPDVAYSLIHDELNSSRQAPRSPPTRRALSTSFHPRLPWAGGDADAHRPSTVGAACSRCCLDETSTVDRT